MTAVIEQQAPSRAGEATALTFRHPVSDDGKKIWDLIASCPPLDQNSLYCNLLQCTHFASTCMLAEREGALAGWISAYRPPQEPATLFVWQVAVSENARGLGLGKALIGALLASEGARGVTRIKTTITEDNAASWALFNGAASALKTAIEHRALFERDRHFGGRHDTEFLVTIGPFEAGARSSL